MCLYDGHCRFTRIFIECSQTLSTPHVLCCSTHYTVCNTIIIIIADESTFVGACEGQWLVEESVSSADAASAGTRVNVSAEHVNLLLALFALCWRVPRVLSRVGRAQCFAMALVAAALCGAVALDLCAVCELLVLETAADLSSNSRCAPQPAAVSHGDFRLFDANCSALHLVFADRPALRLLYCAVLAAVYLFALSTVLLFLLQVAFRTQTLAAGAAASESSSASVFDLANATVPPIPPPPPVAFDSDNRSSAAAAATAALSRSLSLQSCGSAANANAAQLQLEQYLSSLAEYRVHTLALVWLSSAFALKTPLLWDFLHVHLHLYRVRPAAATLFLAASIANACFVFLWMFLWLLFTLRWGPRHYRSPRAAAVRYCSHETLVENSHAVAADAATAAAIEMHDMQSNAAPPSPVRGPLLAHTQRPASLQLEHKQLALENPAYEPTPVTEPQRLAHTPLYENVAALRARAGRSRFAGDANHLAIVSNGSVLQATTEELLALNAQLQSRTRVRAYGTRRPVLSAIETRSVVETPMCAFLSNYEKARLRRYRERLLLEQRALHEQRYAASSVIETRPLSYYSAGNSAGTRSANVYLSLRRPTPPRVCEQFNSVSELRVNASGGARVAMKVPAPLERRARSGSTKHLQQPKASFGPSRLPIALPATLPLGFQARTSDRMTASAYEPRELLRIEKPITEELIWEPRVLAEC